MSWRKAGEDANVHSIYKPPAEIHVLFGRRQSIGRHERQGGNGLLSTKV